MDSVARMVVYALLPYLGAFAGARLALARGARELRLGPATTVLAAVVGMSSVVGLVISSVLHTLERNTDRIEHGELWRLVTSLFQQDGGVIATFGNVIALLIVGSVCEQLLGGRHTVAVFFDAGILAQVPALVWQPVGAGNSVANFGITGAVGIAIERAVRARGRGRHGQRRGESSVSTSARGHDAERQSADDGRGVQPVAHAVHVHTAAP